MLTSPILDIAIALSFIYFLLGLIASTINEIIITNKKIRNKWLKFSILNFFFDDEWKNIRDKVIESPFVQSLKRNNNPNTFPAYLPSRNFALALMDILREDSYKKLDTTKVREILESPTSPIQGSARTVLLGLLDDSEDNYEKFIKNVEKYYDDVMDRVTGWFKKEIRIYLIIISFLIATVLNIDSILIARTLWQDKDSLKKAADIASSYDIEKVNGNFVVQGGINNDTLIYVKSVPVADNQPAHDIDTLNMGEEVNRIKGNVKSINYILNEMPIPIGWSKKNYPPFNFESKYEVLPWLSKLMGWIVTTLAIFLGSPFWFDLLNKVVNVRGNGRSPSKVDTNEPSIKQQAVIK